MSFSSTPTKALFVKSAGIGCAKNKIKKHAKKALLKGGVTKALSESALRGWGTKALLKSALIVGGYESAF